MSTPWYCGVPLLSGWCTDEELLFTRDSQVANMAGMFGPGINPELKNQALADFGNYLDSSKYEQTVQKIKDDENPYKLPNTDWMTLIVGVVVIGVVIKMVGRK